MKLNRLHKGVSIFLFVLFFSFPSQSQDTLTCNQLITKGIDDMMQIRYVSALENLTKAQEMAIRENWHKQKFLSTNNIGLTYYKMMDYGKALQYFLEAYEMAIHHKNPINEMTVLNNIAIVYMKEQKNEIAESYFLKSFEIAKQHKIDNRIGFYATNLAQLNLELKKLDMAESFINIALPKLKNEPRVLLNAEIVLNSLYFEKNRFEEVIRNGKELLQEAQKQNFLEEQTELQLLLGKAFSAKNQWNDALYHIDMGLNIAQVNEVKVGLFELQSYVASEMNLIEKALSAKDSIINLKQIINDTKNRELIENTALRIELSESRHNLEINETKTKNVKKNYLLLITLLVFLVIILIVIFYKRNQIAKQKKIISENLLKIKNLELEQEKIQSDVLKNEIEKKNKILSDKILFQTTRNELIEEVINHLINERSIKDNTVLLNTVRDLKQLLKEDSKWEEFTTHFEHVNNELVNNLNQKHPNLNANDIRFLSFIYLNLSQKEIASILNISPESCRKRKERIVKKLELDSNTSLYQYLMRLS